MLTKISNLGFLAVFAATLFLGCGQYNEKSQANNSKEVATAMNIEKVTLDVQGMTCSGCEYNVESALKKINGVATVKVDHSNAIAEIQYNSEIANVKEMVAAVNKTGYKATAPKKN